LKNRLLCQYIALNFALRRSLLAALVLLVSAALAAPHQAAAKSVYWGRKEKTVTLDPGHGGETTGARSTDGRLEKNLTLLLSRRIAEELTDRYRSVLTRSGDYDLDIERRTAVANHEKSDAFVSVHLGGSFLHQVSGIHIYYFKPPQEPESGETAMEDFGLEAAVSWDHIQQKHLNSSRLLAQILGEHLQRSAPTVPCTVRAAPLLVLRGADMPAVLLEAGHLTNADDRRALLDEDRIDETARAVAEGLEAFFKTLTEPN